MKPGESFVGQPIRALQTMLRVIAENDPSHMTLIPDGIYGPDTVWQREFEEMFPFEETEDQLLAIPSTLRTTPVM